MAPKGIVPGVTPGVTSEYATLNGRKYHYLLGTPVSGRFRRTVVLVHGFPDLAYGWRNQFEPLMGLGLRVVAIDCMGYGRTEAPTVPPENLNLYSYRRAAADIKALAQQLGLDQIVIGGHDWGAFIAYRTYQYYPELVSHIFTITVPYRPTTSQWVITEDLIKMVPTLTYQIGLARGDAEKGLTTKDDYRHWYRFVFSNWKRNEEFGGSTVAGFKFENLAGAKKADWISDEEIEYYVNELNNHGVHGPSNYYKTRKVNYDDELMLKDKVIHIPAMFIIAEKDPVVVPAMYNNLDTLITHYTVRSIKTGHWAMLQDPDTVNKYLTEWFNEVVFGGKSKI